RSYGQHLGMAFQIMDDVLDFVGEERQMGKPVGSDLRQGIATLPVYHYLKSGGDAALVEAALGRGSQDGVARARAVDQLVSAVVSSPAIEACREEARGFVAEATHDVSALAYGRYGRALQDLAAFVVTRDV
ncbi:MAG: polyprenyl synthetase family protein, partial [Anaerolineae bacterium]|nr:polyprenyl synthetase family protein [Anaerolineae bacterium]